MELTIIRYDFLPDRTFGKLYIDGEYWCETLEDRERNLYDYMSVEEIKQKKVYGETAIPYGKYEVKMTYSIKYEKELPQILNVPGFAGVRIHNGSFPEHSLGCILIGRRLNDMLTDSRVTTSNFVKKIGKESSITLNIIKA